MSKKQSKGGTDIPDPTDILYTLQDNEFFIGSYVEDTCPFRFTGDIAEVRVWDRALSSGKVLLRAQGQQLP